MAHHHHEISSIEYQLRRTVHTVSEQYMLRYRRRATKLLAKPDPVEQE